MKLPNRKATFYFTDRTVDFEADHCIETSLGFLLENDVNMSDIVITAKEREMVAFVAIMDLKYWLPG